MGTGGSKDHSSPTNSNAPHQQYIDFAPGTPHAKNRNDDKDSQVVYVPTMFRWPYSGRRVFIVGTFNHWKEKIPMTYNSDENSFVVILNVSVGKHLYRFIVDNEYKTDPNSPTCKDDQGYLHNVIEIKEPTSGKKSQSKHLLEDDEEDEGDEDDYDPYDDGYDDEEDILSEMSDSGNTPSSVTTPSTRPSIVPPLSTSPQGRTSIDQSRFTRPVVSSSSSTSPTTGAAYRVPEVVTTHAPPQQHAQQQHHHYHQQAPSQPQQQQHLHAPHHRTHSRTISEDISDPQHVYTQLEHYFEEDKKNPPLFPPHLRFTVLNSTRKSAHDPALLPVPLHVTVNHAYFSDRESMNVIGVTQRYRDKFSTAVLYKPKKIKSN